MVTSKGDCLPSFVGRYMVCIKSRNPEDAISHNIQGAVSALSTRIFLSFSAAGVESLGVQNYN